MTRTRTQVAIVGGGPAGMLLAHVLGRAAIDSVVLERRPRAHVLARVRAGLLEDGTVGMLREHALAERMEREGRPHRRTGIAWGGREHFLIDIARHTGRELMAFGQTALTEELYRARERSGGALVDEAADVALHDIDTSRPWVSYEKHGRAHRVDADFVAGCDGYHGASRRAIPPGALRVYEKTCPFGWLGILARTPPLEHLVYANHPRGFALCSERGTDVSRCYVQCPLDDTLEDWPDQRFWEELRARVGPEIAARIEPAPAFEKSIAPLRSFVAEPMRHGTLFLAGDAAHIVPPTGAKGLNLAVSDVHYLSRALVAHYAGDSRELERYSETALRRVWGAMRFSWQMTLMLHRFPEQSAIDRRLQEAELVHLATSEAAQRALAEQYVGLPY